MSVFTSAYEKPSYFISLHKHADPKQNSEEISLHVPPMHKIRDQKIHVINKTLPPTNNVTPSNLSPAYASLVNLVHYNTKHIHSDSHEGLKEGKTHANNLKLQKLLEYKYYCHGCLFLKFPLQYRCWNSWRPGRVPSSPKPPI